MSNIKKILLLIIVGLFIKIDIVANAAVDVSGGGLSFGSNSLCRPLKGRYTACYLPKFQFRLTLVNPDGTKVDGTKSVDFSYSEDGATHYSKEAPKVKDYNGNLVQQKSINKNYRYLDSEEDANNSEDFRYIQIPMIDTKNINSYRDTITEFDDPNKYSSFMNEFSHNIKNRNNYLVKVNSQKYDILSAFIYYSGYGNRVNVENKEKYNDNIKLENYPELANEIIEKNYYLLIEPTYTIYFNTEENGKLNYYYGTAKEFMNFIYRELKNDTKYTKYNADGGYLAGLSLNFVLQTGCNLNTPLKNAKSMGYYGITQDVDCSNKKGGMAYLDEKYSNGTFKVSKFDRLSYMEKVANPKSGYGQYVLRLSGFVPKIKEENMKVEYNVDLCTDNQLKITRDSALSGTKKIYSIKRDEYKIDDSGVYCYDELTYDFNDIVNNFSKTIDLRAGYVKLDVNELKLTIKRTCYFDMNSNSTKTKDFSKYTDISKNTNKNIKINSFNNVYDLEYVRKDEVYENDTIEGKRGTSLKAGWEEYTTTIYYGYANKNIYLLPNHSYQYSTGQSASIDFSDYKLSELFDNKNNGMIEKLLKNLSDGVTVRVFDSVSMQYYNYNYSLKFVNGKNDKESLKCNFSNNVIQNVPTPDPNDGDPSDPGNGDPSDPGNGVPYDPDGGTDTALQFRVISLSNPFPARDGTSRLPGTNWLNKDNNVYEYIVNNRAIQYPGTYKNYVMGGINNIQLNSSSVNPDMMYIAKEPIYKITLDPATMVKIRQYNKSSDYGDINKNLSCDDNNRQCVSGFLRNTSIIKMNNFSGTCAYSPNFRNPVGSYSNCANVLNNVTDTATYSSLYDVNKNHKMDVGDRELCLNIDKQTNFYECADKTYKSGG